MSILSAIFILHPSAFILGLQWDANGLHDFAERPASSLRRMAENSAS